MNWCSIMIYCRGRQPNTCQVAIHNRNKYINKAESSVLVIPASCAW